MLEPRSIWGLLGPAFNNGVSQEALMTDAYKGCGRQWSWFGIKALFMALVNVSWRWEWGLGDTALTEGCKSHTMESPSTRDGAG